MANQVFELLNTVECDTPPEFFYTDPKHFTELKNRVVAMLKEVGGRQMKFTDIILSDWSGFMQVTEGDELPAIEIADGSKLRYMDAQDHEIEWDDPQLTIWDDGSMQLCWVDKNYGEKCWFYFK